MRGDAELSEDNTCQVLSRKLNTAGVREMNEELVKSEKRRRKMEPGRIGAKLLDSK